MPGYVIHLALGELLLNQLRLKGKERDYFLLGCIAPDAIAGMKKTTHFWSNEMCTRFARKPEPEAFEQKYYSHRTNPFVMGYYSHLFLDKRFIEVYWKKHFSFFDEKMNKESEYDKVRLVYLKENKKYYPRELFFSENMYYGDYDSMNGYFVKKYDILTPSTVWEIPDFIEELPEDACIRMAAMLDKVQEDRETSTKPVLKVFNLSDMEKLITDTAGEIKHSMWIN